MSVNAAIAMPLRIESGDSGKTTLLVDARAPSAKARLQ